MKSYMALFRSPDFDAPAGCEGGFVGETDVGYMAVYRVPADRDEQFMTALARCDVLIRFEELSV